MQAGEYRQIFDDKYEKLKYQNNIAMIDQEL